MRDTHFFLNANNGDLIDRNSGFGVWLSQLHAANRNLPTTTNVIMAEADVLAVEAMYLGADMLEMMRTDEAEADRRFIEEQTAVARALLGWGAEAQRALATSR